MVCSHSRLYWFTVPGQLNPACTLGLRFAASVYSHCFHGWKLRLLSLLLSHIPGSPHIAQTDKERLQRLCLPTCCWRGWWQSRVVEGWDLMHNEMGFDQREKEERKSLWINCLPFFSYLQTVLRCRSQYPPCGDDMEACTANFVRGGAPLHAPSCLLSLFFCLTLLPQDYISLPPSSPGKFACSLLSLSFLW